MKSVDLIPLILLELKDGDKYGLEFSKNIESKSNGKILIKQPTLYTILKKLEKSKFITSYWTDSEIGGKRHYYKLTQNGINQVATLPKIDDLINSILFDEENESESDENKETELDPSPIKAPIESILPKEEVFSNENIDNLTELDINQSNSELISENSDSSSNFATNENVTKFTTVNELPKPEIKQVQTYNYEHRSLDLPEVEIEIQNSSDIKYVDYTNFFKSPEHIYSKNITKKVVMSSIITSLYIILATLINVLVVNYFKPTAVYYSTIIISLIIAIFIPINALLYAKNNYFILQKSKYDFALKKSLLFDTVIFLSILLIIVAVNLIINNNTFIKLLEINNYANFYAPLLIGASTFVNTISKYILMKNILK